MNTVEEADWISKQSVKAVKELFLSFCSGNEVTYGFMDSFIR